MDRRGFTLVEIMIVVSIIGVLAMLAIPGFIKARRDARAKVCINNLRLIDSAIEMASLEEGWEDGYLFAGPDIAVLGEYAKGGTNSISCPSEGDYQVVMVGSNTTCTYDGHVLGLGNSGGGGDGDGDGDGDPPVVVAMGGPSGG